jgi:hypothetical protein
MSDNLPGTPPLPGRHEPPPIPPGHEPPPVPDSAREFAAHARHEPPPVPTAYEPSSIPRDQQPTMFVVEGSRDSELAWPVRSNFESPLVIEIESETTPAEVMVTKGPRPARQPTAFLPWLALSLALLCLPPSIVAALVFVTGLELWPFVLICSLLAICFGRYARDRGGPSANLANLAFHLGRGFFVIGLIGLVLIGMAVATLGIATVQAFNTQWRQTNRSVRWVTDNVDAVKAYFSGTGHKPPPADPSPSPNSSPAP